MAIRTRLKLRHSSSSFSLSFVCFVRCWCLQRKHSLGNSVLSSSKAKSISKNKLEPIKGTDDEWTKTKSQNSCKMAMNCVSSIRFTSLKHMGRYIRAISLLFVNKWITLDFHCWHFTSDFHCANYIINWRWHRRSQWRFDKQILVLRSFRLRHFHSVRCMFSGQMCFSRSLSFFLFASAMTFNFNTKIKEQTQQHDDTFKCFCAHIFPLFFSNF